MIEYIQLHRAPRTARVTHATTTSYHRCTPSSHARPAVCRGDMFSGGSAMSRNNMRMRNARACTTRASRSTFVCRGLCATLCDTGALSHHQSMQSHASHSGVAQDTGRKRTSPHLTALSAGEGTTSTAWKAGQSISRTEHHAANKDDGPGPQSCADWRRDSEDVVAKQTKNRCKTAG